MWLFNIQRLSVTGSIPYRQVHVEGAGSQKIDQTVSNERRKFATKTSVTDGRVLTSRYESIEGQLILSVGISYTYSLGTKVEIGKSRPVRTIAVDFWYISLRSYLERWAYATDQSKRIWTVARSIKVIKTDQEFPRSLTCLPIVVVKTLTHRRWMAHVHEALKTNTTEHAIVAFPKNINGKPIRMTELVSVRPRIESAVAWNPRGKAPWDTESPKVLRDECLHVWALTESRCGVTHMSVICEWVSYLSGDRYIPGGLTWICIYIPPLCASCVWHEWSCKSAVWVPTLRQHAPPFPGSGSVGHANA